VTPDQIAAAMPQIEAHVTMGLLAFPAKQVADTKQPAYAGWQTKRWDLGMLEVELATVPYYGLTQPKDNPRRLVILDLDDGRAGLQPGQTPWQERWKRIAGIPKTKVTSTPSGGAHAWFIWPDEARMPGASWHGFTVRKLHGAKNWAAGPGSVRPDGRSYHDVNPGQPIATMPLEVARSGLPSKLTNGHADETPERLTTRDEILTFAGRLRFAGAESSDIEAALVARLADGRIYPSDPGRPWTADGLVAIAADIGGRPRGLSWTAPITIRGTSQAGATYVRPTSGPETGGERPWPRPRSEADPSLALADPWIIDGVLRPGRMLIIAAAESVGKTQARHEMTVRLVTGHGALFNHYRIPRPVRVVWFDVEDGEEEELRREEEVLERFGLPRSSLSESWGVSLEGISLTDAGDQAYIRGAIEQSAPAVVFFDTGSSMVGDEWGAELKAAIRFVRGLARQYGCAVVILVHLVKPAKAAAGSRPRARKPDGQGQHGTSLADVMGQWTRQADTVAMMAPAGAGRVLWTVRKRAPHSQLVLKAEGGTFDVLQVVAGEDLGVGTMERIHGCIATGHADAAGIATYLEITERTVWRHVKKLREAGRVAPDAPLRLSDGVSAPVSRVVSPMVSVSAPDPTAVVTDMSPGRTDTVSPPVGGDGVIVSQSDDLADDLVEPEEIDATIAVAFPDPPGQPVPVWRI
jgi:hypothetical protein